LSAGILSPLGSEGVFLWEGGIPKRLPLPDETCKEKKGGGGFSDEGRKKKKRGFFLVFRGPHI